ncbi:MAG: putative lipid II flippase FtsW [Pseudomonadales bacterium]|nr:putative lipid II flippase FtsW [Pseudomonadales bacterium]MCP5302001.1 putative lipid II flippase FtsW [Pseudomonadales bacterium]
MPYLKAIRQGGLDRQLMVAVAVLLSIGLVMISSASVSFADHSYGDAFYFLKRHMMFLVISAVAAFVVVNMPSRFWYRHGFLLLLATLLLLVAVLIPGVGREVNGSQRWIPLGPFNLQVSEVAKLVMILFVAGYLERHQRQMRQQWQGFAKPVGVLVVVALLLLVQPDFGSAVVMTCTVLGMLFVAGVRLWQFSLLMLSGVAALVGIAVLSPYRVQRLVTFLDPWADQFNGGYQLTQSLIAYGRGEWLGVGIGNSVQKLFYLPEAHTDFVFSIFAEEFGLVGVITVVALFSWMVGRILLIAKKAVRREDWFAAYSCFGVAILLAGQAFINIGVTSGLLPTKGLTLPFISYGGSSLVVCCVMVALTLRIGSEMDDVAAVAKQVRRDRAEL